MPWPRGKPCSESTKAKISKSLRAANRTGENSPAWRGGRCLSDGGYVLVRQLDHPNVGSNGYVFEHRLVMEKALGRYLESHEVIHHKNGNKTDNRLENLELITQGEHVALHRLGVSRTAETRARISASRIARFKITPKPPHSPETRAKISAAKRAYDATHPPQPQTPEARAKISAGLLVHYAKHGGKKHSAETRAKMSAIAHARHAAKQARAP